MKAEAEIKNAIIESARLHINDHGILDLAITVNYGGSGQGFGGYTLHLPKSFKHWKLESPAGHFIMRCLEVAGVEDFDQLKGRSIRVRATHYCIEAIGHIIKDDWFCPKEDFASLVKEGGAK